MINHPESSRRPPTCNLDVRAIGLAVRLRARRLDAGLSRQELADQAGLTERTVRDIENENRDRIQDKTLILLAEALGCPPGELADLPAVEPAGADASAAAGGRPRRRGARWALFLGSTFGAMLLAAAASAWYAFDHAEWEVVEGDLVARDGILGRVIWTIDEPATVRVVTASPWSNSLYVGFAGNAGDGAQAWRVDRTTGRREASFAVDEGAVRRAFGDEILSEGQQFACTAIHFMEFDGDGDPEVVLLYTHGKYYPAALAVHGRNGERLGHYVHRGHIKNVVIEDLDLDGRDEALGVATNNDLAYQGATVFCLGQGDWSGAAVDPPDGPGRGPVGGIADGARYRLVLPSFGDRVMPAFEDLRIGARNLVTNHLEDGSTRVMFVAGVDGIGVSVLCDGRLRPILADATDNLKATVRAWPEEIRSRTTFPSEKWIDDWLERARWTAAGSDEVVFGPVEAGS